ncbi:MAG: DUF4199 domain-containing protein [Thermoflexibacter sp.]|jgi:hypothetical protein|nr:DUF4199 domain-containing protein [Thermoflexibacter sp.]
MSKFKTEIKWAFIFALMMLVWMLLEKLVGLHSEHIDKHYIYTNFVAIPAITIYVFALLEKRNRDYEGQMSYQQGIVSGIVMSLIITLLSPIVQLITSFVITPEFFPNAIKYAVEHKLLEQEEAEKYFSLSNYLIQGTVGAPIMGLITTVIVALFVKKS